MEEKAVIEPANVIKTIPLMPDEQDLIEEKLQSIVILKQIGPKYYAALEDIHAQTIISMVMEPYGRDQSIAVIAIATANNTYIIDIQAIGEIFHSLRVLLESEYPIKIMHFGNRISDQIFYRNEKIILNGIYDTFAQLCSARQDDTECTLPMTISLMLDVQQDEVFWNELNGPYETIRLFQARPLSQCQVNYLAKLAMYQFKLYDRFLYNSKCSKRH